MGDGADAMLESQYPEVFGNRPFRRYVPPEKRAGRQMIPGTLASLDLLRQTQFHITKDGTVLKPEDMTPRHRGNTVRLWERRAEQVRVALLAEMYDRNFSDGAMALIRDQDPIELVHSLGLFKHMLELGIE